MAKVRLDFVSNSSSSSFVVSNAKKFIENFSTDFKDISLPWELDEKISVTLKCLERDATPVEKYFSDVDYVYKPYSEYDIDHKWKTELDDDHYIYGARLSQLLECPKDILEKIDKDIVIVTSEENDEFGKMILRLLMNYCKMRKLKTSIDDSEIDFTDQEDFFNKVFELVMNRRKRA